MLGDAAAVNANTILVQFVKASHDSQSLEILTSLRVTIVCWVAIVLSS